MAKNTDFKEGAPFLGKGGFRTAVQARAEDRKAAQAEPNAKLKDGPVPPVAVGSGLNPFKTVGTALGEATKKK